MVSWPLHGKWRERKHKCIQGDKLTLQHTGILAVEMEKKGWTEEISGEGSMSHQAQLMDWKGCVQRRSAPKMVPKLLDLSVT
jgi:hypothetical protein